MWMVCPSTADVVESPPAVVSFVVVGRFFVQSESESGQKGVHPVDIVLLLVILSFAAALVLLDRFAIPAFAKTYEEFAATMPLVTRAVLSHVAPLAGATAAVMLGILGMFARYRGSDKLALSLGLSGIAVGVGSVVFCFYALYVPVFELADKIKP
jgi:hypothetical protein